MKLKFQFDKDAIKDFFFYQSEKIVLMVVGFFFVLFAYGAVGRETFPKTPQDLNRAAAEAEQHIANTPPVAGCVATNYEKWVKKNSVPVEGESYKFEVVWNPPIFKQKPFRGEPRLFAVRELRGAAAVGAISMQSTGTMAEAPMTSAGGTRGVQGQRWVVVTGLVPITEQEEAYRECFLDAKYSNPQVDVPEYIYYRIERAKIDPNDPSVEPQWERLNLRRALAVQMQWSGTSQSMINPDCYHEKLTFPLPPLADREWDETVVHEPEISIPTGEEMMDVPEGMDGPEDIAPEDDNPDVFPEGGRFGGRRGMPGMEGPGMPGGRRIRRPTRSRMPMGEGMMDPEMGIGRMPRRGRAGMPGGMAMAEQEPSPYYLFRFFDFNVEPGTYYRYRVRLLLANPNKDLPRRFVKPPELVEKRWVETDWSEPTNPIFVPRDDRVLAVSVKPPRRPWDEPSGKILAVHWDMDLGLEVSEEFDVQRGLLANFPDRDASFLQNRRPISIGGLEGGPGIGGMLGGTEDPEEQPKVDYRTEALVLDMAGGERLSRRDRDQTSPGKILLLAANGNLVVHDELEDARAVASREKPEEVETIPGRGRPEGREMGPGGEFGEFEGMPPFGGEAAGRGRGRRNPRTRQPPRVPGREM